MPLLRTRGIVQAPKDHVYKTRALFLDQNWYEVLVYKNVFKGCVKQVVQNPTILHDNARSHTATAVTDLLRRWKWGILGHPSYSPDMRPCDNNLFAKAKEPLRGTRYNTRDELIRAIGRPMQIINNDGVDAFQTFVKM